MDQDSSEDRDEEGEHTAEEPDRATTRPADGDTGEPMEPAEVNTHSDTNLQSLLHDWELETFYPNKLSPSDVMQIDRRSVTDDSDRPLSSVPWVFLKKLMMVNVTARDVKHTSEEPEEPEEPDEEPSLDVNSDSDSSASDHEDSVSPSDVVTALFLCSDRFLQQEMVSKMSMCQFSVPLLLPDCETQRCTLMLWAMRDIVKKFRPHSLSDQRSFVEERIVHSEVPLVSFVRLGDCGISKSHILNKLLSNSHQYHDTFVHREMECGGAGRRISDGLVEMSWYLPSGNKNCDVFPEAVAVANLRGDLRSFTTQYSFLCQTSTAVFVFFDNLDANYTTLAERQAEAQIVLVGAQKNPLDRELLRRMASEMRLRENNIILKDKQKDAQFVKRLISTAKASVKQGRNKVSVEGMTSAARDLGIEVDEDVGECQRAKDNADKITKDTQDTLKFKEERLPRHGRLCKDLAKLEKEHCRLRKAGDQNLETYKSDLQDKMTQLRKRQRRCDTSPEIDCFIRALSTSSHERKFFLKWMRMNLDDLSQKILSSLRETYKEKCQQPEENKEEIAKLDQQIPNSSLGTEHFLRELGQIYEAAVSLPEASEEHEQMLHLPRLCAQLMLEGFPLELVDGDASNVPLRWVSDVLKELNSMLEPNNRVTVVTVLGVQSSGKSTLLNTMFGAQFAVSSGRCTRGAFMQMMRVSEELQEDLSCDFLLIIDTEGLKSPELTKLDDSYEHDNELATLVVGLSDITIINIAMENSTEMKDVLQIVVHAFLRMKEIGKKPNCLFVHQNVADVSAHDKNMRDRKLLLEQLNEMTEAAAKMENKEKYKLFTDVMDYDPDTCNWYVPGLWHGNPPMAPVNAGYSDTVYDLKKNMVKLIGRRHKTSNITEFLEWMRSLWGSVKYENFIFSFRNSLVADAYMKLCLEYNSWRWTFKKQMNSWITGAETRVSNDTVSQQDSHLSDLLVKMKGEADTKLDALEKETLENLSKYFDQEEGNVNLVVKYRQDFANSVKSLRKETQDSVHNQLQVTVNIRRGMIKLDNVKKTFTDTLEKKVLELLEKLRNSSSQRNTAMSEKKIEDYFARIWRGTEAELSVSPLPRKDIYDLIFKQLRENLKQKGSSAAEKLSQIHLKDCGKETFKVTETWLEKFFKQEKATKLQNLASAIIQSCEDLTYKLTERESDYHDTYNQEILNTIDETLKSRKDVTIDFEVSLKLHVCGASARHFQLLHDRFIEKNNPLKLLRQSKEKYCSDFKDLYHNRDQCQRKAEEFTKLCLVPAVENYIFSSLGPDIVEKMTQGKTAFQFSTRTFFQYTLLKKLLCDDDFNQYVKYLRSYEDFVKNWILDQICERFSGDYGVSELEERHLREITGDILKSVKNAQEEPSEGNVRGFLQNIRRQLGDKLIISTDALDNVMVLNKASLESFTHWLDIFVVEQQQTLRSNLKMMKIETKLERLKLKPQDELFKRVSGCGKQCPFCRAPCDADGEAHAKHSASVHMPQGLGGYKELKSKKMVTNICSTDVHSEGSFRCSETNEEFHPYKKYRKIFPDWHISPDNRIQASDYWKYVMARFNKEFAEEYEAEPGDVPSSWKIIRRQQAEESLKVSFDIK